VKRQLKPRTRNGGKWTEAQYWAKLRSALRQAFKWWEPAKQAVAKAKYGKFYTCAACKARFPRKQVQADHVTPCGPLRCLADVAPFLERLTPEDVDAFQVLCETCHQQKTNDERRCRKDTP
jgi:hypothetical protein